ncbi:MAG TPA: hypothetical protein PLD14_00990 [Candidatus Pacearchaeota archaeon]|nr:hypothetical protein [Candidatus Pacearchaeota archaeon]HPR79775.1 hypothetical protein [Candidatus Pacearchaeota archaeon]
MAVDKAFNIKIETQYLHPEYLINSEKQEFIGTTGLLKIFELTSPNSLKPFFWGRWDPKEKVMDIDIYNTNNNTKKYFKNNKKNCRGHHPELIDIVNRTFKVSISILGENIYQGLVFFSINHTLRAETGIFAVTGFPVNFELVRNNLFSKIISKIWPQSKKK